MSSLIPDGVSDPRPGLQGFFGVMMVITITSVSLRFWSRRLRSPETNQHYRLWLDDWFAFAAAVGLLTKPPYPARDGKISCSSDLSQPVILAQLGLSFALLARVDFERDLARDRPLCFTSITLPFLILYYGSLFLTRASALFFLCRTFPAIASPRWFNYSLRGAHAMNLAWLTGISLATGLNSAPGKDECAVLSRLNIGGAIPSLSIDLFILILPMPRVVSLRIGMARKIGLVVTFALGYCVIIASLGRLITVFSLLHALDSGNNYLAVPLSYWTTAEPVFSILGVCLPAMLPLGRYMASNHLNPMGRKISAVFRNRRFHDGDKELHTGNGYRIADESVDIYDVSGSRIALQQDSNPRGIV